MNSRFPRYLAPSADERPSDRLARAYYRWFFNVLALACLANGIVKLMDERAALAAASAGLALALVLVGRLLSPP